MSDAFDIVVIGAGIAGPSIAAELSLECRVLLPTMHLHTVMMWRIIRWLISWHQIGWS